MKKSKILLAVFMGLVAIAMVSSCNKDDFNSKSDVQLLETRAVLVVPTQFQRPVESTFVNNSCYPVSNGCSVWLSTSSAGNGTGIGKLIWTKSGSTVLFTRPISSFAPSADLGAALGTAPLICNESKRAHHIIPWERRDRDLIQKAAYAGFHPNDFPNGVYLNAYSACNSHGVAFASFHNGSHPAYTAYVTAILNNYWNNSTKYRTKDSSYDLLYNGILPFLKMKCIQAETAALTNRLTLNSQFNTWAYPTSQLPITVPGYIL